MGAVSVALPDSETRVRDAKIGDYVLVARRSGREWYVGAMTDWTARELEVDFSFLPEGEFKLDAYQDGVNAGRVIRGSGK